VQGTKERESVKENEARGEGENWLSAPKPKPIKPR